MIHTRWKKLVIAVGLAMISLVVGTFLNVGVASAADKAGDTADVHFRVCTRVKGEQPKTFMDFTESMAISNGVTMQQGFDEYFPDDYFTPNYDAFDVYNVIFKYADDQSAASYEKAVQEIMPFVNATTAAKYEMTPRTMAEESLNNGFKFYNESGYKSATMNLAETKEAASQKLQLTKLAGSSTYQADFYINLESKPSDNIPVSPVHVDQSDLTANSSATITVGQKVDATTFNAQAKDSSGNEIPVTVDTSQVNLTKPGTYDAVLKADNGKTMTVKLTINAAEADTETVVPKKSAIYGLKTLYLYQKPTFKQNQRIVKYTKAKRTQRPMFVVTGYARSNAGLLRYLVKDVNHNSKTAGKTGYITARTDFVGPVYYQKAAKRIKVLSKSGINAYRNLNLTGKVKTVKQGKTLKVIAIKRHNLTTRFVLQNGQYITANKKLVMAVK